MNDTLRIQPKRWRLTIKEQNRRRDYQREESAFSVGQKEAGQEEWKDVVGYEGRYRISSFGRIFKIWKKGGGLMKGHSGSFGYIRVHLTGGVRGRPTKLVHRLVAEAFLEKRDGASYVNHKDFNPVNNRSDNLEWVTPGENVRYSAKAGRMCNHEHHGEGNPNSKLTERDVVFIKSELRSGKQMRFLARQFGVTDGAISHIKHGRQWLRVL